MTAFQEPIRPEILSIRNMTAREDSEFNPNYDAEAALTVELKGP